MKKLLSFYFLFVSIGFVFNQNNNETLLTIDSTKITSDEFIRIFNKNSNINSEEKRSVDDYLELFINYKLKVIEAKNLGYDTVPAFINELKGYKEQLSIPYIEDETFSDSLSHITYERMKKEVNVSDIVVRMGKNSTPKDTLAAYNKAIEIRNRILAGESFADVAVSASDDPSASKNKGDLGWFTSLQLIYPYESYCYNAPIGEISKPVKTVYGYHIVKVNAVQPARGEALISHIATIFPRNLSDSVKVSKKEKIEKAYEALQNGVKWEDAVNEYSEHLSTAKNGGSLGWLKVGTAPTNIIDTSFSLMPGKYSLPFETFFGYHILKVEDKRPVPAWEEAKETIEKSLKSNQYINEIKRNHFISITMKDYVFKTYPENLEELTSLIDSGIYTGTWDYNVAGNMNKPVFSIGDKEYSQFEVAQGIAKGKNMDYFCALKDVIDMRFKEFVDNAVYAYGKENIASKNPELKALLDEYSDGILLFNLTENEVWKKAIADSAGLEKFYNGLTEKQQWEPRVKLTKYSYSDSAHITSLLKIAKTREQTGISASEISAKICPQDSVPCISITEYKYEKGDNAIADSISWKRNAYLTKKTNGNYSLYFVESILPKQDKQLNDARGLYTADYQTYLEKQWIQELRNKYSIAINTEVLEKIKKNEK